jgi:hypothetical protein
MRDRERERWEQGCCITPNSRIENEMGVQRFRKPKIDSLCRDLVINVIAYYS